MRTIFLALVSLFMFTAVLGLAVILTSGVSGPALIGVGGSLVSAGSFAAMAKLREMRQRYEARR